MSTSVCPESATSSATSTRASPRSTRSGTGGIIGISSRSSMPVELDVHRERVLHVEGIGDRAADEEPAARDAEEDVRPPRVRRDLLGRAPDPTPSSSQVKIGRDAAIRRRTARQGN